MKYLWRVPLSPTVAQAQRLQQLQATFAQACNDIAADVASSRIWHRVTLHHLHYRPLRAAYPDLGSQLVCNAIYAVSKWAKLVYQNPHSPAHMDRHPQGDLPTLRFGPRAPVYFDRHTLSVSEGRVSLFTLEGRLRMALTPHPQSVAWFKASRLLEILMVCDADARYHLLFVVEADAAPQQERVQSLQEDQLVLDDAGAKAANDVGAWPSWENPQQMWLERAA